MDTALPPSDSLSPAHERARLLNERHGHRDAADILRLAREEFGGELAIVSSFGSESAIILHLAAQIDRTIPILFLDTLKHFDETLTYRDILLDRFQFSDARAITPAIADLARHDRDGTLWQNDHDLCCHIRKVLPLERALDGFSAWVTGRKRHQSATRGGLQKFEPAGEKIKINPLADWSAAQIDEAFLQFKLPRHPLWDEGFLSIGCSPEACTRRVAVGENTRAGRWSGTEKVECGIHRDYTI
ncbi:MAG TPA: phosphoadenylyl-sulfate reductase [Dongiaceae bacterium]|jgi:phosphoadenosine phosphosulfate reductase|nr:phosphoadenylyl-sulfate reductase [Dongiaceae bacterium]